MESKSPSLKPALIFVGSLVVLVIIGLVGVALTSSSRNTVIPTKTTGLPLKSTGSKPYLKKIITSLGPPSDVVNSILLPQNVLITNSHNVGVTSYDSSVTGIIAKSPATTVNEFFKRALSENLWYIQSDSTSGNITTIIARYPSNDGFYWGIGIKITGASVIYLTPTSLSNTPVASTQFNLRLYELPDPD